MLSRSLHFLLALSLVLLGGCGAPRRPASLDYVPNFTADTVDCTWAELIDVNYSCRSATTGIAGRCQVDGLPR